MKKEIALTLSKTSNHAKNMLAEEYYSGWAKYKYSTASSITIMGILFLTKSILFITTTTNLYVGALLLFFSLMFTFVPWYFILRQEYYHKLQILSEAILTIHKPLSNSGQPY